MSDIYEGTGNGLVSFLDWTAEKGLMKPGTASGYRSAVSKVLEIDGEEGGSLDIKTLNVEHQLQRFSRISGSNYTPSSLRIYKTRFRNAVEMYRQWLDNPSGFKASFENAVSNRGKLIPNRPSGRTVWSLPCQPRRDRPRARSYSRIRSLSAPVRLRTCSYPARFRGQTSRGWQRS